jgi:hypothetical protein
MPPNSRELGLGGIADAGRRFTDHDQGVNDCALCELVMEELVL